MHRESDKDGRPATHANPDNEVGRPAAEMRTYLELLFPPIPGRPEVINVRGIHPEHDGGDKQKIRQLWAINLDEAKVDKAELKQHAHRKGYLVPDEIPDAIAKLERDGFNCYVALATRTCKGGNKKEYLGRDSLDVLDRLFNFDNDALFHFLWRRTQVGNPYLDSVELEVRRGLFANRKCRNNSGDDNK